MDKYLLFILLYMLLMSIVTFILYAADKRKAEKGKWRIRESTLILFSFLGGSVGAMFGMFSLRHKTKHVKFLVLVPLSLLIHVAILAWLIFCR